MKDKVLQIFYTAFTCASILLCVYVIWINLVEVIERAKGHSTLFGQITTLYDAQAIWYSIGFLIPNIILLSSTIYFFAKAKIKNTLIISVFIWILFFIELFTDNLFRINI